MSRQDRSLSDSPVGEKLVLGLGVGPVLARQRDLLPELPPQLPDVFAEPAAQPGVLTCTRTAHGSLAPCEACVTIDSSDARRKMPQASLMDRVILWIKRSDSALPRFTKRILTDVSRPSGPHLPRWVRGALRVVYEVHYLVITVARVLVTFCYRHPLFQSRCTSFGRGVVLGGKMPFVTGHTQIHVGDQVTFGGNVAIISGRMYDEPKLIIGNRCAISWNCIIAVNREVVLEDDVWITHDCRISDSEGHPREIDLRLAGLPADPREARPVRICRGAWIGNGTHIMKGVTIGEGAVIGANSVVISNIPAYALAMGNPAEVYIRNFGLPAALKKEGRSASSGSGKATG